MNIGLYIADLRAILTDNDKRSDVSNRAKELFLPQIFRNEFNLEENEYKISLSEHGKPLIISSKDGQFHFNISHSANMWICAVATQNIGVDIEKIKSGRKSVVDYYFTKKEQGALAKSKNFDRDFFKIWTAKEAYAKFCGSGLSATLMRENNVSNGHISNNGTIQAYIHSHTLNDNYIYTIACNSSDVSISKHILTEFE